VVEVAVLVVVGVEVVVVVVVVEVVVVVVVVSLLLQHCCCWWWWWCGCSRVGGAVALVAVARVRLVRRGAVVGLHSMHPDVLHVWDELRRVTCVTSCAVSQADFHPLYRCLHIYEVMGIRSECETYYKTQRKIQAESDLVLRPFKDMPKISEYYEQFFHKVAGFFLIEDTVLSTTQGLLTKQWVDDLWDVATREIARVLPGHLRQCETVGSLAFPTTTLVHSSQPVDGSLAFPTTTLLHSSQPVDSHPFCVDALLHRDAFPSRLYSAHARGGSGH
jgi:hypothetical protein